MSDWFYADRQGQQRGPVQDQDLLALRQAGQIDGNTLVWRNGMADWKPLAMFEAELGASAAPGAGLSTGMPTAGGSAAAAGTAAATADAGAGGYSMYSAATPVVRDDPRAGWNDASAQSPYDAPRARMMEAAPVSLSYAGFWKRFAAAFLDGLIVGVPVFILMAMAGMMKAGESNNMVNLVLLLVGWPYYALMESSSGQTLGKRALGIRVTDLDGDPISFGRATGRYFSKILSALILYIGYIMAAFTSQKQALHDMIASTLVVED